MHNLIKTVTFISLGACISFSAQAIENQYKPYVGLNYAYTGANAKNMRPHHNGFSVLLGSVYNPYFGTELFYQYGGKDNLGNNLIKNTSFTAYGLDTVAYLPLGCSGAIAPLATLGIGEYTLRNKLITSFHKKDHGYGYRFGGGLGYNIDEHWALRGIARYIKTDKIKNYDHMNEYTLGLKYVF